jgi:hypothetical protein
MLVNMKIKYIFILCLVMFEVDSFGHDQIVHQAITANAAASAMDESPAYGGFINTVSSDLALKDATNFMVDGSYDEDYIDQPGDVGGKRSLNHFYDPLDNTYYKGLSDSPPDFRILTATNSFAWASISNCVGYNFPGISSISAAWSSPVFSISATVHLDNLGRNVNTSNIWSWQNARGYEWLGLTATNKFDRQTNLLSMFRAVGQVMHLLEDTSQPQHVRSEQRLN